MSSQPTHQTYVTVVKTDTTHAQTSDLKMDYNSTKQMNVLFSS